MLVKAGKTDVSVEVFIADSTTGAPLTGKAYNSAGIDLKYRREFEAAVSITEATLAALTTAHADGGFLEIGNGWYRLDLPDDAVDTAGSSTSVVVFGTITGGVVYGPTIQLVAFDPADTVRLGLTAMPNVASGSAGAIVTAGTGTAQLSTSSGQVILQTGTGTGQLDFTSGVVKANVTQNAGTNITASAGRQEVNATHIAGSAVSTSSAQIGVNVVNAGGTAWGSGAITSGAFASGAITAAAIAADAIGASELAADAVAEIQSGLATAANLATVAGYLDTEIAAILADTNELQTDWADGGRLDLLLDDCVAVDVAAIVNGVWDEPQSNHPGAGTFGLYVDSTISTRASQTSVDTIDGIVDAIKVKTDFLPSATAGASGGVFIAGTNAATTVTSSFTTTFTGNLTGNVGGNVTGSVGSLATQAKADVNAEVVDVLRTDTATELSAVPAASPNLHAMVQYVYMAERNKIDVTATAREVHNDAGTVIGTKTLSDDGSVYSETKAS